MNVISCIKEGIEKAIKSGKKIALYPMGDIGIQVRMVMREAYDMEPDYIFDNKVCEYNKKVLPFSAIETMDKENIVVLFSMASDNKFYDELLETIVRSDIEYVEMECYKKTEPIKESRPIVGKYSYGDICESPFVEKIGAFCSFASGSNVLQNHPSQYISTHPFLYFDKTINSYLQYTYEEGKELGAKWYFDGVKPRGVINKAKKSIIGNDVWLGANVQITNGANIGNGVIAGAGAVITKDVPDYAIVAGVPARIIGYRYSKSQIEALNRISWWDWTDEEISERYDDFFISIDKFIDKYDNMSVRGVSQDEYEENMHWDYIGTIQL